MTSKGFYTASLTNVPEAEKDFLKAKSCILAISVGQEYHEGGVFRATLRMINDHFKKCTIVVCDTLQRHTLTFAHPGKSDSELYDLSYQLGYEWIQRNEEMINQELRIPHTLVRWEHWLKNTRFTGDLKKVKNLYAENEQYRLKANEMTDEFVARHKKRIPSLCLDSARKISLEYLLEERSCVLQWPNEADYIVYPSIKDLREVTSALELLELNKNNLLLKIAGIKFEKHINEKKDNLDKFALENIVKTSPGHIYWKNKHGTIQGCNLSHAKSFGFSDIESVIGITEFDAFDYDKALEIRKNDLKIMRSEKTLIVEESAKVGDKNYTYISHKSPIKNSNGSVIGILGVSIDITKQKQFEQQLKKNEEQLERKNRELKEKNESLDQALKALAKKNEELQRALDARKEFLRNVSHEIKTPLSCILNMSNLVYDDWDRHPNNEIRKSYLKIAVDSNNRLEKVLTNLLDLSKVEGGTMKYKKENYSLKKSTQDVVNEFIHHKDRIKIEFKEDDDFEGLYDPLRIEQVIRNLLANALSYGGTGDITIKISRDKNSLVFSISDQGVGIPTDELESIFDMFIQSSRTKTGAGGTGIGLSICRNIIHGHDGKIWAENNKDNGSTFWFCIPADQKDITQEAEKNEITNSQQTKIVISNSDNKRTLLLIDDDPSVLMASSLILEYMGFEVISADRGMKGLEMLKANANAINVVLLDIMMPDVYGLDLLQEIKTDYTIKSIPVYMYSGMADHLEVEKSIKLGASGFINKTSTAKQIKNIIGKHLL